MSRRRWIQPVLVVISFVLFLASLPGPFAKTAPRSPTGPSIDVFQALLGYDPVGFITLVSFVAVLRDHDPVGALIAVPVALFFATPFALVPHRTTRGLIRLV